jgi:hypothetical protein
VTSLSLGGILGPFFFFFEPAFFTIEFAAVGRGRVAGWEALSSFVEEAGGWGGVEWVWVSEVGGGAVCPSLSLSRFPFPFFRRTFRTGGTTFF